MEINNLNAAYPTSFTGSYVALNQNRINSSTAATFQYPGNYLGIYPTAEAHEKIKILTAAGDTMSDGFFTLYGI